MKNYAELSDAELIAELEVAGDSPNPDLIEAILARREDLTPKLLSVFADSFEDDWETNDDPRWYRGAQAARILLHWREPAALPLFGEMYERGGDDIEWFEERVAHYGPPALPIFRDILFMETDDDWHYGRAMTTSVLEHIAHQHPEVRGDVIEALHAVLPALKEDGTPDWPEDKEPDMVWSSVAVSLADLRDQSSRDRILPLYDADLIDETVMTREGYLRSLKEVYRPATRLRDYNLMAEIRRDWGHEQARLRRIEQAAEQPQARPAPLRTQTPKVGRNEPCPCGSGRKYKHCCGKK